MIKNRLALASLSAMILASTIIAAPNSSSIKIVINNETTQLTDAAPYIEDGRTIVPIRVVSENLGATVNWNNKTQTFEILANPASTGKKLVIEGTVNEPKVLVNKVEQRLDSSDSVVVTLKNGRTYVPLRFFSEALGYDVNYNSDTKSVYITGTNTAQPEDLGDNVIYNPMVKLNYFITRIPFRVEGMTTFGAEGYKPQAFLGPNGCYLTVSPTSKYEPSDDGFNMKMVITAWNDPNTTPSEYVADINTKTMDAVKKILSMYTVESDRVFKELDFAITDNNDHNGHTVKTSDGRTFKFTGDASAVVVRIK